MTYTGANRSGAWEHSLSHDQEISIKKEAWYWPLGLDK